MSSQKIVDLRNAKRKQKRQIDEPPAHTDKRVAPLRVRRRRIRIIALLLGAVLVAMAVYGVHWASYLPRYTISNVAVEGTHTIDPSIIKNHADAHVRLHMQGFISHANILLYDTNALARDIVTSFHGIKSATVSRVSPLATDIVVRVEERQPYALWCADSSHTVCYLLDESGFIFATSPMGYTASSTPSGYVFVGGIATSSDPIGQIGMREHLPGIITLLKALTAKGFTPQGATTDVGEDFSVPFTQGFFIKASFGEDADPLAKNLQLIISSDALKNKQSQIEYVDLRFGDRVYFKLKGEAKASSTTRQ